jgi:hypothetical protein
LARRIDCHVSISACTNRFELSWFSLPPSAPPPPARGLVRSTIFQGLGASPKTADPFSRLFVIIQCRELHSRPPGQGRCHFRSPRKSSWCFAPDIMSSALSAARSPGPRAAPAVPACPRARGPLANSRFASSSAPSGLPSAVVSAHPVLRLTRQDNCKA